MLAVKNLVKKYQNTTAVNNLSFTVDKESIFGLLGPNGAGKTTTVRMILNIIKPDSGSILINGTNITDEFYNKIGYLPEDRGLYKKSKVIDVICYFAGLKGLKRNEAYLEAEKWLKKLDISHVKTSRIEELSKGNQQKIQFIVSIIHNPLILILDEPFSGFDPINQQLVKEIIISFVKTGRIVILCTHLMEMAEKLCTEIILLNKGECILNGTVAAVKKSFSHNRVKLEYTGDISFLSGLPQVINIENKNSCTEIELLKDYPADELPALLSEKIKIKHFSIIEPTLHDIFIEAVKGAPAA